MIKPDEVDKLKEMITEAEEDSIAMSIISDFMKSCKPLNNVESVKYNYQPHLKGSTFKITLSFYNEKKELKKQVIKFQRHDIMQSILSAN